MQLRQQREKHQPNTISPPAQQEENLGDLHANRAHEERPRSSLELVTFRDPVNSKPPASDGWMYDKNIRSRDGSVINGHAEGEGAG